MDDEMQKPEESAEVPSEQPLDVINLWDLPDPVLRAIAGSLANDDNARIGLTLWVRGLLVSGQALGPRPFFNQISGWVEELGTGEGVSGMVSTLKMIGETMYSEDIEAGRPMFVHLVDARSLPGPHFISTPFMRIRIESIDAFMIGEIKSS